MKRTFDLIFVIILSPLIIPTIFFISLLVLVFLGRPIFFFQERLGLHGKAFKIYKFRTMKNLYNSNGDLLDDEVRVTKFGGFIRSYSLDEFPNFLNVFLGQMSIVGPRPLLVEYKKKFNHQQSIRMNVKPGITGWAQINGRNKSSWEDTFNNDLWYLENQSLLLDLKIILSTILVVLLRKDVAPSNKITKSKFQGQKNE